MLYYHQQKKQYKMNVCFDSGEGRLHMFGRQGKRAHVDSVPKLWECVSDKQENFY